jgi:hypothetical protein
LIGAYRLHLSALFCNSPILHLSELSTTVLCFCFLLVIFFTMHLWQATVPFCLLAAAALPGAAATAWGFTDATVAVQPKGAGVNGGFKEQYAFPLKKRYLELIDVFK